MKTGFVQRLSSGPYLLLLILVLTIGRFAIYGFSLGPQPHGMLNAMCKWDCGWYMQTAPGYQLVPSLAQADQADWAFFPIFPLLIRLLSRWLHIPEVTAGFMAANISLALFIVFAARYLHLIRRSPAGMVFAIFVFVYPYGFYYAVPYTESTYAAFTMLFFYLRARDQPLAPSFAAALAAGTRVTGVLLTVIVAVSHLKLIVTRLWQRRWHAAYSSVTASLFPVAIAPLGLFLFMAYLYHHVGDAYAFVHVQRAWNRPWDNPFTLIYYGLRERDFHDLFSAKRECATYAAVCAIAGLAMTLRLSLIKRFGEAWFLGATILLALSAGFGSIPRYVLDNPIFLVSLFDLIWRPGRGKYLAVLAIICVVLQLCLVHLWVRQYVSLI